MLEPNPFVSIIIPARNEETRIGLCLQSILAGDYPHDRMEVLVVDGGSSDGTRDVAERVARSFPSVRVLDNPRRIIPAAMNIGIEHARGEIFLKVDAHSLYPPQYVSRCVRALLESGAGCVGGVWTIAPGADTIMGRAIAAGLSHPFASGNAYVKIGVATARWADTVAFGCYRREPVTRIGGYNERLAGSSDLDLNTRLRWAGSKIWLEPEIVAMYFADPDLRTFWRHNFADGVWATYVLKFGSPAWRWRHWIPLAFVLTTACTLGLSPFHAQARWAAMGVLGTYGLASLGAALQVAMRARRAAYLWAAPLVFLSRHVAHGVGALYGLGLLLAPGNRWRGRRTASA